MVGFANMKLTTPANVDRRMYINPIIGRYAYEGCRLFKLVIIA